MWGTIAAIVSIAVTLAFAGQSVSSTLLSVRNQKLRTTISNLVSNINKLLSSKRLDANKLLSLLQSKNSNAMLTYLQNNPVISRNLAGIQKDADLIAEFQAEQSSLEAEIASLQNELMSLGYSQSHRGTRSESTKVGEISTKLEQAVRKYKRLGDKIKETSISTTNPVQVITSDIDARSQNINGGMNNNGL